MKNDGQEVSFIRSLLICIIRTAESFKGLFSETYNLNLGVPYASPFLLMKKFDINTYFPTTCSSIRHIGCGELITHK